MAGWLPEDEGVVARHVAANSHAFKCSVSRAFTNGERSIGMLVWELTGVRRSEGTMRSRRDVARMPSNIMRTSLAMDEMR